MSSCWDNYILPALMKTFLENGYISNRGFNCESANNMESLRIKNYLSESLCKIDYIWKDNKSFLLLDAQENLKVPNSLKFLHELNCVKKNTKVKVVSIFGNAGDGKSHTMNETFFNGREVFKTSNKQDCCTLGVWAAFDPVLNVICLDTEGLQGITNGANERIRLLLKVLAVSDIVIYRIQSERLNRDLFTFLGAASHAYSSYFKAALQAVGQQDGNSSSLSILGPSIIVLHETRHTIPLTNNGLESAEDILKLQFSQMKLEIDAFSSIKYVGLQTMIDDTDYSKLRCAIEIELNNTTVRLARKPELVYNTLKTLNTMFCSELGNLSNNLFPNQYFTCPVKCLSCGVRCNNSMGHLGEGKPHNISTKCRYQRQYENLIDICKKCYKNGKEVEVSRIGQDDENWYGLAANLWSGYSIECPNCGEIYKSTQYWYYHHSEDIAVRKKVTHVWNTPIHPVISHIAQGVADGVFYFTDTVANVSLQPAKVLTSSVTDQVTPSYSRSNHEIKHCFNSKVTFGPKDCKHHCRDCGESFYGPCSSKTKCVPTRNWRTPVRAYNKCYDKEPFHSSNDSFETVDDIGIRKVKKHALNSSYIMS